MIAVQMYVRDAGASAVGAATTAGREDTLSMAEQTTYELHTPHLRLRALSLGEARLALARRRADLGRLLEARVPTTWPSSEMIGWLPTIVTDMERQVGDERWLWLIIEQATARVVGDSAFHGPVMGATVELGWQVVPARQGRGFATEAAAALLIWAAARPGVERVIARIAPENGPSLRVAAKLGMREIASAEPNYRRFEWLAAGASSD